MTFTPPPYPYERLSAITDIASRHEGGAIDCSIGTPIDPPPTFVLDELGRGAGVRGYPPSQGTETFRSAAASWLQRRFDVTVQPDNIAACIGTKEFVASLAGFLKLRAPDRDTVLYPAISYPSYAMGATLAGLRSVPVPVHDGRLALELVSSDDRERALLLWSNVPSNPTGSLDDLSVHAQWGREHGVLVASDECYCEFTWDGQPRSILQHGVDGVLAVHSISKRSNLAGIRAGFYTGDPEVVAFLRLVRQHAGFMVPAPVQAAVELAYGDDEHVVRQRAIYLDRLALMSSALETAGFHAPVPQGGFYLWVSRGSSHGWELAGELAERTGLVTSPGDLYGEAGLPFVRIAVVQPTEKLALAASRLRR